jgi:cysteine-rich repeat protein
MCDMTEIGYGRRVLFCAAGLWVIGCGGRALSDSDWTPDPRSGSPVGGAAAGGAFATAGGATPGLPQAGGRVGSGGVAQTGGLTSASGGQSAFGVGGSTNACQLPDGSCAPGCYNLDPCFSDGCPPNCVQRQIVICGNGKVEVSEGCDDGNVSSGDGCSEICSVEPGFVCPVPGKRCQRLSSTAACDNAQDAGATAVPVCGDGIIQCSEQCDDGINDGYAGCTSDCMLGPFCGDGVLQPEHEECDDGINDGRYGGCTADCRLGPHCGDGIVQSGYEDCDSGPRPISPCLANCRIDIGP